jgi:hypothetical protein
VIGQPAAPTRCDAAERYSTELYVVIRKNRSSKDLGRVHLGSALPYGGCLHHYLRQGKWISRKTFQLSAATFRKERWGADLSPFMR